MAIIKWWILTKVDLIDKVDLDLSELYITYLPEGLEVQKTLNITISFFHQIMPS